MSADLICASSFSPRGAGDSGFTSAILSSCSDRVRVQYNAWNPQPDVCGSAYVLLCCTSAREVTYKFSGGVA